MPLYEMQNLITEEKKDFFFLANDAPALGAIIHIEGEDWKRIITVPPVGIVKNSIDPYNANDFLDKTKKSDTIGSLYDQSAELSEQRAKQSPTGRDPVRDKWFDDYSKKRSGKKHIADDRVKK